MSPDARGGGRERILLAATERIASAGLGPLAMRDVAADAEVTAQLVNYHFPNREALIRASFRYALDQAPSTDLMRGLGEISGFDAVREALHSEFDDTPAVRAQVVIWNEVSASQIEDPGLLEELDRAISNWNAQLTIGVLRGVADGSIRQSLPPADIAVLLTAAVEGLGQRWLAGISTSEESRRAVDELMSIFDGRAQERGDGDGVL